MAPEKLIIDPLAVPVLLGMAGRVKGLVITKGIAMLGTSAFTLAFSVGVFYEQMSDMQGRFAVLEKHVEMMQHNMTEIQRSQAIMNNNMVHMTSDIEDLTAQASEIFAHKRKIRK